MALVIVDAMTVPEAREHPILRRYSPRRQRLSVKDGTLSIVTPDSMESLFAELDDDEFRRRDEIPPYWADVWPSSVALARRVCRGPSLAGKRVLDLGCGVGVAGCAALRHGADVLFVDRFEDALAFARFNAEHQIASRAERELAAGDEHALAPGDQHALTPGDQHALAPGDQHALAPGDQHALAPGDQHALAPDAGRQTSASAIPAVATRAFDWFVDELDERFDLILAADSVYEERNHEPVLEILRRNLARDGEAWVADPMRGPAERFFWAVREHFASELEVEETYYPDKRVAIRVATLRWPA